MKNQPSGKMEIKLHRHIILFLFCFLAVNAMPQDNTSQAVNNYRETIWLTSNRHLYLPGEIISFKALVFEQDSYQKSQLSKNIRVELMDSKGYPVSQQNLILEDAGVYGTVLLPREATTGWYYLRAYTNWMRNFSSNEFGLLAVKVVNPQSIKPESLNQKSEKISISLYPQNLETGLFAGFHEKLGIAAEGWLLNHRGDTLTSFSTHTTGWAHLPISLSENERYVVSLKYYSSNQYNMQAELIKSGDFNIDIKKDNYNIVVDISGDSPAETKDFKLMIHQSYTLLWESEESSPGKAQFNIPKSILPSGVMQFSLMGDNMEILGRRLWSDFIVKQIDIDLPSVDHLELRSPYTIDFRFPSESTDLSILL